MKSLFASLAVLSATNTLASNTPIEPVLVPIVSATQNINIQMGKYEVTVAEFTRFATATGHTVKQACHLYNKNHHPRKPHGTWNNPDLIKEPFRPVVCIGASDAIAYAKWLSKETGKPYRLPEFSEWQYAASAGKSSRFAYGEDMNTTEVCDYENIEDAANNAGLKQHHNRRYRYSADCNDGAIYHTVVGMYRPNDLGLHDMMGNVRELTQTCRLTDKNQPNTCKKHIIAGSGWHWVPRPINVSDSMDFIGSVEGFRLVLDTDIAPTTSKDTQTFISGLALAQQKAEIEHNKLKSLPKKVTGVNATLTKDKQVTLNWAASSDQETTYTVYRSYLDPQGKISRRMKKIGKNIDANSFIDNLPEKSVASYQVFANNAVGESQPSAEVSVGEHQLFSHGERIQAERYNRYRNTFVLQNDKQQDIYFSSNEGHYPPEVSPFVPAWLMFDFESKKSGNTELAMRVRGSKGAVIEFWQGKNLVAKVTLAGSKEHVEIIANAKIKAGRGPLQIRQGNKKYFVLDWFEFK